MTKRVTMVVIDPAMATAMLEKNTENRSLKQRHVDALARDMASGNFAFNGDAIRIREDGVIADGQHRLWACVQSGVSFETLLFSGVTAHDMLTIDRSTPRTAADMLNIVRKDGYGSPLSAAVRALAVFSVGDYKARLTMSELSLIVDNNPTLLKSIQIMDRVKAARGALPVRAGVFYAIHYIGSQFYGETGRADDFIEVLQTGIPSYSDDPAHRLRDVLLRDRISTKKMTDDTRYGLFAAAWEKFQVAAPAKLLRPKNPFNVPGLTMDRLKSGL